MERINYFIQVEYELIGKLSEEMTREVDRLISKRLNEEFLITNIINNIFPEIKNYSFQYVDEKYLNNF